MRTLITAFALLAIIASPGWAQDADAAPAEKVTIKFTTPKIGEVQTVAADQKVKLKMNIIAGEMQQQMGQDIAYDAKRIVTVLATNDKGVSKAKVQFLKQTMKMSQTGMDGSPVDMPVPEIPISGNSYILTFGGDTGTTFKKESGEAASEEEIELIKADILDEQQNLKSWDDGLKSLLNQRALAIGQSVSATGDAANKLFLAKGFKARESTITLKLLGKKTMFGQPCAEFEMSMTRKGAPDTGGQQIGTLEMEVTTKGKLLVGINNGRIFKQDMTGPITASGDMSQGEMQITIQGTGNIKVAAMIVYSKATKKVADK